MTKCNVCGYDDKGTGDRAHVCNAPAKHMSEQSRVAFEKFFPRPLVFKNKAHELEMIGKWNDAKINWETSLEAATAEANKRIEALEVKLNYANDYIRKMDSVIDNKGITRSCINPLVDLTNAVDYAVNKISALEGEVEESEFVIKQTTTLLAEICLILKGEPPAKTLYSYHDLPKMVRELQASNNDLREAIETALYGHGNDALPKLRKAISATPAESLAKHGDELIERVANEIDKVFVTKHNILSQKIRALKVNK